MNPRITIVGAGLVGALTATLLAQRGFDVKVFERRPDPRTHAAERGRSINLSLTERGLRPLRAAGVADAVLAQTVTMTGRMVHAHGGRPELQRYGIDDAEVDHSIARADLNVRLLDAAEHAGAQLQFDAALVAADLETGTLTLANGDGYTRAWHAGTVLGCDGAASALRQAMVKVRDLGERIEPLHHGYKELAIPAPSALHAPQPAGADSGRSEPCCALEPHALHIWPRGSCMCIALPNLAGDFTVTLFLAQSGADPSFATLPDAAAARAFFAREFAELVALLPTFDADWAAHPVGHLGTLYLDHWHVGASALLLGDAAHAVVPFHGQGMNAGLEDAAQVAAALAQHPRDPATAFAEFEARRKPDADAIAQMSLDNYREMRDGVTDPRYLLRRELGAALTARVPRHFMSRYRMVSFTSLPYAFCLARARTQTALLDAILADHHTFADIDVDGAANRIRAALTPLPSHA